MRTCKRTFEARGFTLIELLTSMAIASIIMILLLGIMDQSSSTYRDSKSSVSTLSDSRAFLQFFDTEISSRLPRTPLLSEISNSENDKIAFVRAASYDEQTSATEGDLRTSFYYVEYTADQLNGPVSPKLFRKSLNASATQALLESGPTPAFPNPDTTNDEPIVYNVVNFKARAKYYDATGTLKDWNNTDPNPPVVLELTIDITDDATAARFTSKGAWQALRSPENKDAKKSVRSYTRTIHLAQ